MPESILHNQPPQPKSLPNISGLDPVASGSEYYKLGKAAMLLGCLPDELLHLGAIGKAEIMAPVLSTAIFEWPVGSDGMGFPKLETPFQILFNASDRVILSKFDLAKIEAVGWTNPSFFYAPSKARNLIENYVFDPDTCAQAEAGEPLTDVATGAILEGWTIRKLGATAVPDGMLSIQREFGFHSPWHEMGSITHSDDGEKSEQSSMQFKTPNEPTTTAHLFISKVEVQRLKAGSPQDENAIKRASGTSEPAIEKNINHLNRHAAKREPMWEAAVYSLAKMLAQERGRKVEAPELRDLIGIEAMTLWKGQDFPVQLSEKIIEEHLGGAMAGRMRTRGAGK